ncbi:hypothetical protein FP435_00150 (plasmid) [Lactobacillus sp. PV037]|uniref:hypothetical protein n=1 Tax=Lactobacillus sp. PV037 TaxID=2594496 RepID=UPI00223F3DBB|nr:hypothetical protein [Lactobacillus sp. PV037]QNQ82949.1 hypothetical protein FP435_00150 [Lactobacillus sp. PV037]
MYPQFEKWTLKKRLKYTPKITNEDVEKLSDAEWEKMLDYYNRFHKKRTPLSWKAFSSDEGLGTRMFWIPKDFWGMVEFFELAGITIGSMAIGNMIAGIFF